MAYKSIKNATDSELTEELERRADERKKAVLQRASQQMEAIVALGKAGVDAYAPWHSTSDCSDERRTNSWGETPPRCARCALLDLVESRDDATEGSTVDVSFSSYSNY